MAVGIHLIAVKMTQNDNILQELNELKSSLTTATSNNVYTVPVGYFDGLAVQMLNCIKAMNAATASEELSYLSPMLSNISKQMPYTVPSGYFEGLGDTLIQLVLQNNNYLQKESFGQTAHEELASLSPLLSGLKKEMPYSVPQGYFEHLTSAISSKEEKIEPTKVVSLSSRTWIRYAAAAVVVGIITMTGFLLLSGSSKEPGGVALAKLARDVKKMDDTQKDNLIEYIGGDLNQAYVTISPEKSNEVKDLLQGISEQELKYFQEQTEDIQDVLTTN